MSPVPVTVPAGVVLRTINCQDDYSFFLLLLEVHHSTIRHTDLRLSASKSVAPQKVRTVGRAGQFRVDTRGLREAADGYGTSLVGVELLGVHYTRLEDADAPIVARSVNVCTTTWG